MIVANMASFPARAATLEAAVTRLSEQVDRINLCLNEFETVPGWVESFDNLHAIIPSEDYKDIGKFIFSHRPDDLVFLVDDDLPYPDDYVEQGRVAFEALEARNGGRVVAGYHGTIYHRFSLARFLKDGLRGRGWRLDQRGRAKTMFPYFAVLAKARRVTQLGTGTVIARGAQIAPLDVMRDAARRADLRYARWCCQEIIPMVALPREADWIGNVENDEASIFETYTRDLPPEFLEELEAFAFDVPLTGMAI